MQIFTASTCELGDVDFLCKDLAEQVAQNVTFGEKSVGFVVCDAQVDCRGVTEKLSQMYGFDVLGGEAVACLQLDEEREVGANFIVITGGEELSISVAVTAALNAENKDCAIGDAYAAAEKALGQKPVLAMVLQPYSLTVTPDMMTVALDKASGGCPQYGAVVYGDIIRGETAVYRNGQKHTDALLLCLIGGGIRPIFSTGMAQFTLSSFKVTVTEAKGNVVYKAGEDTFLEFMKKSGLVTDPAELETGVIAAYAANPVIAYPKGFFEQGQTVYNIIDIDFDTGAVAFSGVIPEGYEATFCMLTTEEVRRSTVACFEDMATKIENNGAEDYEYTTLAIIVCGARYLLMLGDTASERACIANAPALRALGACGFFTLGELCPVANADGTVTNHALKAAITLMAL